MNSPKKTGRPKEEIQEKMLAAEENRRKGGISRRAFLTGAAVCAAGAAMPWVFSRWVKAYDKPVAIIGAGIAGLSAALTLADAGVPCTVYEASTVRVGGRLLSEGGKKGDTFFEPGCGACHSVSKIQENLFEENQVVDIFGELIDTSHTTIISLANRFNLPLVDALSFEPPGATETYYFSNKYYPKEDADRDFAPVFDALKKDLHAAGYPTTYDKSRPAGRALDNMSIYDWIESRVPGGHSSPMGMLLDVAYNIEFGAETTDQSSLNLMYLLGYNKGPFHVFGPSDERYRIKGGVERLPKAIAEHLGMDSVKMGWILEALAKNADGTYTLTFDNGRDVGAEYVLLAFPFAAFTNVDYSKADFNELKLRAIRELGAGHNSKLQLQFDTRYWNQPGPWGLSGGTSYSDRGYQLTWDPTRGQKGTAGILVNYTGGNVTDALKLKHCYGNTFNHGEVTADAQIFLQQLKKVFPGISEHWNGIAVETIAHLNPFWNSSYCYWRKGQCQIFGGYERVRQGNVFFAGEHTSVDFQGWFEGAASEGVRAGKEILVAMGRKHALHKLSTPRYMIG